MASSHTTLLYGRRHRAATAIEKLLKLLYKLSTFGGARRFE